MTKVIIRVFIGLGSILMTITNANQISKMIRLSERTVYLTVVFNYLVVLVRYPIRIDYRQQVINDYYSFNALTSIIHS